jgi:hypothetical protein
MAFNFDDKVQGAWSPLAGLREATAESWIVDGVIPQKALVWMAAAPESFKTFVALDMAAAVSCGRDWQGRPTEAATVLYVAAEGGTDIHVRRAGAELAAGQAGPLAVVQSRPRLDGPMGLVVLQAYVGAALGISCSSDPYFCEIDFDSYLTPEEIKRSYIDAGYPKKDEWGEYEWLDLDCPELESDRAFDKRWDLTKALAVPRYSDVDKAKHRAQQDVTYRPLAFWGLHEYGKRLLLIIDTYSQTSADDTKPTVSAYIKTLRDLQEWGDKVGISITVMVIDHLTKSGDSFMGSQAKLGDSDVMVSLKRTGNSVTMCCDKMKSAARFEPIHMDMAPIAIEGFTDKLGRTLTTLRVADGQRSHQLRKAAGAKSNTAAAMLLGLVGDSEHRTHELREMFKALPTSAGAKPDAVNRKFLRALDSLVGDNLVTVIADSVTRT